MNAFVVPSKGGDIRQITTGPVSKYFPQWLDRQWMFVASDGPDGKRHLFRLPATGGALEQVTKQPA